MYAAFVGRESVLNMLLDANVKTDIPAAKDGMTAMMFAAYCAGESVMYYLIQVISYSWLLLIPFFLQSHH